PRVDVAVEDGRLRRRRALVERADQPRRVGPGPRLDANDLGAVVGERAADGRARDDPRQVEHAKAGECLIAHARNPMTSPKTSALCSPSRGAGLRNANASALTRANGPGRTWSPSSTQKLRASSCGLSARSAT